MDGWQARESPVIRATFRMTVVVCVAVFAAEPRGQRPSGARSACCLQRRSLHCADGQSMAVHAARANSSVCNFSADAALDEGRMLQASGRRHAFCCASLPDVKGQPTAACIDSRTLQSTPESGARAGYDGAKRRKGSSSHRRRHAGPPACAARDPRRSGRSRPGEALERTAGDRRGTVEMAYVDQSYTGPTAAEAAQSHGIRLEVVNLL